jgi:AmiR/NasT family two-component response regulator
LAGGPATIVEERIAPVVMPEAFRWIQRTAMDRRTTTKAVAQAVVEGLHRD